MILPCLTARLYALIFALFPILQNGGSLRISTGISVVVLRDIAATVSKYGGIQSDTTGNRAQPLPITARSISLCGGILINITGIREQQDC